MTIAPLVVVVDDDAGLIVAIDGLLRSHGYRVLTCCNVGEYLASDEARTAACVITDLRMPGGMNGIDLLEHVVRPCRVILMSAFMDDAARARAERAGVWCILDKPFTEEDLIGQIRAVIVSHDAPPAC